MRTFLLALALYLVSGFSGFQSGNLPAPPASALAKPTPVSDTGADSPAKGGDIIAPVSLPAPQQRPVSEAASLSLTAAKVMEMLIELARPSDKPTKAEMCETLAAAALAHELPVGFFVRLIQQESGFNPEAVSPVGAQGVAQFMPAVAEEWGLEDPFDPHQALPASARFLRSLHEQFGNWGLAAAAYNGGMGRLQKWLDKRGKLPEETRKYVLSITGRPAEEWAGKTPRKVNFTIPARAPCQDIAYLADAPAEEDEIPLPPVRAAAKTVEASAAKAKPARKAVSKVAAVESKIAAPASIVADAGTPKGKRGKAKAVKVAEKSSGKGSAKAASAKSAKDKSVKKASAKSRVRIADAQSTRK